jgi:NAD(P)H-hydrate epimerase
MITRELVADMIRPRDRSAHKGIFGHALLVAGSKGKIGAAILAARGCMRSGAGLLTVHTSARGETALHVSIPEAMLSVDREEDHVSVLPDLKKYDAIGAGPGLGLHPATVSMLENLLRNVGQPLVLDADALNVLSQNRELIRLLSPHTILTPHPKEFERLTVTAASRDEQLHKAAEMAVEHRLCIVLKGAGTAVCTPEGKMYVNTTGNPGMATAGSGDVLTGILTGLLAQGYSAETAAVAGVFLHGLAGDLAAADSSEESMLAGDIAAMLGKAFRTIRIA